METRTAGNKNGRGGNSRTKAAFGALAATACAAILFAVLVLPGLLDRPAVILPENSPLAYSADADHDETAADAAEDASMIDYNADDEATAADAGQDDYDTHDDNDVQDNNTDDDSYQYDNADPYADVHMLTGVELMFNYRAAVLDDFDIDAGEWETLFGSSYTFSNEQVRATFPAVEFPLWTWAIFCPDSNFVEIQATVLSEYVDDMLAAGDDELAAVMTSTRLRVSDRELSPRIQHRAPDTSLAPLPTDFDGVEVTAIVYSNTMHDPFFFRVSFEILGVNYLVEAGSTSLEAGMTLVEELVRQLIASGPVVPSRLQ